MCILLVSDLNMCACLSIRSGCVAIAFLSECFCICRSGNSLLIVSDLIWCIYTYRSFNVGAGGAGVRAAWQRATGRGSGRRVMKISSLVLSATSFYFHLRVRWQFKSGGADDIWIAV